MMNFIHQNNQNNYNYMNSEQALDINMSSMQPQPANTANYSYHHQQQYQQQPSNSNSFGPQKVLNLQIIQQSLRTNSPLTELDVLTMARQALLNGFIVKPKTYISNLCCHRIIYNQMEFVLTEGFDAVVTINWNNQPQQLIGDHINKSTFQQINTNQFNQSHVSHVPTHTFVNNNSPPLRQSVIQQTQAQPQQISLPPVPKANKLIDTTSVDSLGDEECMSEYDGIINEIIDCVNLDVDADPELTDFHDNEKLPPLPHQLTINTNTTYNSCGNNAAYDYDSPIPTTTNNHLALPRVDRLKTQSSFYSINDDNQSEQLQTQRPQQLKYVHSQNNVLFGGAESTSSADIYNHYGIEVTISNALWNELYHRPGFYGQPGFSSKQELIAMITQCIHQNRAPHQTIGDRREFCVWVDTHYVYITDIDMSTLIDVFEYGFFNNQNGQVLKQLNQRKYNIPSSAMKHPSNINQYIHNNINNRKLVKNASGRSILSNASSTNNKNNNNNNNGNNNKDANKKHEYHTIYLKPIIERMKAITYKLEGSSPNYSSIDSDYIIDIVDKSIKFGTKRQISKRTFEFKWQSYTIIMSKSLKTILDVTLSNDIDIITVHPDVVSIISKKCPQLDYFTIQKVAKQAKLKAAFTTKKNDYRQQFIYDYCGCRIVFASNHTTIVEMQCNDTSAINKAIRSQ